MEDRVLGAEGHGVQGAREHQPRTRRGEPTAMATREVSTRAKRRTQCAMSARTSSMTSTPSTTGTSGPAAGDLDVAVDEREEHGPEDRAVTPKASPPEDRAQAHFAEPEPVDVEPHERPHRDDGHDEDGRGDDKAIDGATAPATLVHPGRGVALALSSEAAA